MIHDLQRVDPAALHHLAARARLSRFPAPSRATAPLSPLHHPRPASGAPGAREEQRWRPEDGADRHARHLQAWRPLRRRVARTAASSTSRSTARWPRRARRRASADSAATASRPAASVRGLRAASGSTPTGAGRRAGFTERDPARLPRAMERYAIPFFAGCRLAEVEPPRRARVRRHLEVARAARRRASAEELTPLKAMFATAVEDGRAARNPTAGVRVNRRRDEPGGAARRRRMTRAELRACCRAARGVAAVLRAARPDRAADQRGARARLGRPGVRRSAACTSAASSTAAPQRLKSAHSRRDVPLRRAWRARCGRAARPTGRPDVPTATGTRYRPQPRGGCSTPAAKRAGVGVGHFHTFRHTCASLLFEAGREHQAGAAWLGHADPAFTLRTYVHLMDEGLGDAGVPRRAVGNAVGNARPRNGHESRRA